MSTIKISDLHPIGSELFSDSESFMTELVDSELAAINGGLWGWVAKAAKTASPYAYKAADKARKIGEEWLRYPSMYC